MNTFFNKRLFFSILTIALVGFWTISCGGDKHADHDHEHAAHHEHDEHGDHDEHDEHGEHHHHDEHDDEHSSLSMTIIKDGKSLAFEIKGHRDALFDKDKGEKEVSLDSFSRQSHKAVSFPDNQCEVGKVTTDIEEEGHHKIYVVSFPVECQKEAAKVKFDFADVYSPIKRIHADSIINDNVEEHTVDADGVLTLK